MARIYTYDLDGLITGAEKLLGSNADDSTINITVSALQGYFEANFTGALITGLTEITPVSGDFVLVSDTSDSGNLKKVDVANLPGGGSGGTVDVVSNVLQDTILGRLTAGSGDSEELTPAQVRTLINVENGATADQNAGEVPITDGGGYFTSSVVESALQELAANWVNYSATGDINMNSNSITSIDSLGASEAPVESAYLRDLYIVDNPSTNTAVRLQANGFALSIAIEDTPGSNTYTESISIAGASIDLNDGSIGSVERIWTKYVLPRDGKATGVVGDWTNEREYFQVDATSFRIINSFDDTLYRSWQLRTDNTSDTLRLTSETAAGTKGFGAVTFTFKADGSVSDSTDVLNKGAADTRYSGVSKVDSTSNGISGTQNGVNAIFTTSSSYQSGSLIVFVNSTPFVAGNGLTETTPGSGVFTLDTPPQSYEIIIAQYTHLA